MKDRGGHWLDLKFSGPSYDLYWDADGWPYKGGNDSTTPTTNDTIHGTYAIAAAHSGKALDCWQWGTSNGTNIAQCNYRGGDSQLFNIVPVDGVWHRITSVIAEGQSIDVADCSTGSGANSSASKVMVPANGELWRVTTVCALKCLIHPPPTGPMLSRTIALAVPPIRFLNWFGRKSSGRYRAQWTPFRGPASH